MNQSSGYSEVSNEQSPGIDQRFRRFLPVVVDVETGGFIAKTDALLEIAAVFIELDSDGKLKTGKTLHHHVKPFPDSRIDPASLEITGIDPFHPLRLGIDEEDALRQIFKNVRSEVKEQKCNRAILVGHNSFFDLQFLNAAAERTNIKRNPFHPFSSFDTVTLGGLAFGQTVLARAVVAAGLDWDETQAHSALYDAQMTALLFCEVINRFKPIYDNLIID